jgi:hypothetical protein
VLLLLKSLGILANMSPTARAAHRDGGRHRHERGLGVAVDRIAYRPCERAQACALHSASAFSFILQTWCAWWRTKTATITSTGAHPFTNRIQITQSMVVPRKKR